MLKRLISCESAVILPPGGMPTLLTEEIHSSSHLRRTATLRLRALNGALSKLSYFQWGPTHHRGCCLDILIKSWAQRLLHKDQIFSSCAVLVRSERHKTTIQFICLYQIHNIIVRQNQMGRRRGEDIPRDVSNQFRFRIIRTKRPCSDILFRVY